MLFRTAARLPIATNGGGDFYVYVTAGKRAGAILFYLHDARRRPVVARSLTDLANDLAKALDARKNAAAMPSFKAPVEPLVEAKPPRVDTLRRAPIGTLYYRRALPYRSYRYRIFVKVNATTWVMASGCEKSGHGDDDYRIGSALGALRRKLASNDPAGAALAVAAVQRGLADDIVFPDNVPELEGRSPRADAYFARRMTVLPIDCGGSDHARV